MRHHTIPGLLIAVLVACTPARATAQPRPSHRPSGRVSVTFDTWGRGKADPRPVDVQFATAFDVETPDFDGAGTEYRVNLRQSMRSSTDSRRWSLYDGYVGYRFGSQGQVRVRAGHMWLPDLGSAGGVAGGLVEYRQPRPSAKAFGVRAGVFAGREALGYTMGYVPNVQKVGGYLALERGFLRRHIVGFTRTRQGAFVERSVVTVTNFVPIGSPVFIYQVAEFDVTGPANGEGRRGLAYLLVNARATVAPRVEVLATVQQGRSIDARTLTDDLRNGRSVTPERLEGLRYASVGGRATVEVARNVRIYAGYSRDQDNRNDQPTGRLLIGGHAGNLGGSGLDVSASNSRIDRPLGPYHSRYVSIGHALGRRGYVSVDYATSLSVVRFVRSDGVVIDTRPRTRRVSGNGSVTLSRRFSLIVSGDLNRYDDGSQFRTMTGFSIRF